MGMGDRLLEVVSSDRTFSERKGDSHTARGSHSVAELLQLVRKFAADEESLGPEMRLPVSLTASERAMIHEEARQLGLCHETEVVEGGKQLKLWKK